VRQTLLRILLQAPAQQTTNRRRRLGRQRVQVGLARQHGRDRVGHRFPRLERVLPRQHLVEHTAERPHVGTPVDGLPARLFRAHVRRRAENDSGVGRVHAQCRRHRHRARLRASRFGGVQHLRQPEVEHFHAAVRRHFDVGGLQIAMDDTPFVRRFQRLTDLPRDGERVVDHERPARDDVGERLALDQLENDCDHRVALFEAVDRSDVRVV
jgi:hypothetical protein